MKNLEFVEYKVLFVCLGNICRSPMGETIMQYLVEEKGLSERIKVDSAGTAGYHIGEMPDMRMQKAARSKGYVMTSRARKVSSSDFYDFDIILAMDDSNYDDLCDIAPSVDTKRKVHRMVEFCKNHNVDYVPDPYYGGADGFSFVIDILEDACSNLLNQIIKKDL